MLSRAKNEQQLAESILNYTAWRKFT